METAVHVFRFVRREEVEHLRFRETAASALGNIITAWPELLPRPDDIILLTKAYIAAPVLAQPPQVFCPAAFMEWLDQDDLAPACLSKLGIRQFKELRKSADFFEAEPRCLHRTAAYLRSLCDCDGTPGFVY